MDESRPRHERKDLPTRPIAVFGISLAVVLGLVAFGMGPLLRWMGGTPPSAAPAAGPPGAPPLEVEPERELRRLRAAEDSVLRSYEWIDRSRGIVRIPVERAMQLLAERGLPARKP